MAETARQVQGNWEAGSMAGQKIRGAGRQADDSTRWELVDLLFSRRLTGWTDRGPGQAENRQTR